LTVYYQSATYVCHVTISTQQNVLQAPKPFNVCSYTTRLKISPSQHKVCNMCCCCAPTKLSQISPNIPSTTG